MKTSYFAQLKKLQRDPNLWPVGIAIIPPPWARRIPSYFALAPANEMLKWPRWRYVPKFQAMLDAQDAQEAWDRLHELAASREPVLLCYERTPFTETNWCHRRIVAEWFRRELGQTVEEWTYPQAQVKPVAAEQTTLF